MAEVDMTADSPKYRMSISLGALKHLGIGLYSNTPAVISEAVANAWDADATCVDISFEGDDSITITDNGHGMNIDDANNKYLHVGYERRKKGGTGAVTRKGRQVMGRKGIGKLSLFSLARMIEVHSIKDGELHGFRMNVDKIEDRIKSSGGEYFPDPIDPDTNLKRGTKIILSDLKRKYKPRSLRKRLARRFSIIGDDFKVRLNGEEITTKDRMYGNKIQYVWTLGETLKSIGSGGYKKFDVKDKFGSVDGHGSIRGWIGTVYKPSMLDEDDSENSNRISILVRGKLAQEDVLDEFEEGRIYAKYVIGEIHADFLDQDDKEDIATTSRQKIIEDDERYAALKTKIRECLKHIQARWTDLRNVEGEEVAMKIPAIKEWFEKLEGDRKKTAKKLFGQIHRLPLYDDGPATRNQLMISCILAFESLKLRKMLDRIDALDIKNISSFRDIFLQLEDLEASSHYQTTKNRMRVIDTLAKLNDDNDLEGTIQKHIFNNLWLIDPSWSAVPATEHIERGIKKAFELVDSKIPKDSEGYRLDIKYRNVGNRHVVVELKRPKAYLTIGDIMTQVDKYRSAISGVLEKTGEPVEFVCILGRNIKDWDKRGKDLESSLNAVGIRVLLYKEMIQKAQEAYREYYQESKHASEIYQLITKIEPDDVERISPS
ncbi:MAG: ATP-binding protein [Hyphomicrobiaceae bacterium]|nr:ATP-binding protein [Hyphomicrobiaceae bacterium]